MFDLHRKHAIVTGGGSGIGKSICETFAAQGAVVHVLDLSTDHAGATLESIRSAGGNAFGYACNVADPASVEAVMESVKQRTSQIDILVNNAGIAHIGTVETTSLEDFDRVYQVNVKGVFIMMKVVVPMMKAHGGSIVNLASIASEVGLPDRFAYSMSKGAVLTMTYATAKDLLAANIRVNAVSPARVHTPFVDGFLAKNYPGQESEMFAKLSATQPIGRMGMPQEVAALVLYLASDESAFVTGTNFPIDGGFLRLNT